MCPSFNYYNSPRRKVLASLQCITESEGQRVQAFPKVTLVVCSQSKIKIWICYRGPSLAEHAGGNQMLSQDIRVAQPSKVIAE